MIKGLKAKSIGVGAVAGQTWTVELKKDGNVFFSGQRTTHAPSGSFEVRRV